MGLDIYGDKITENTRPKDIEPLRFSWSAYIWDARVGIALFLNAVAFVVWAVWYFNIFLS